MRLGITGHQKRRGIDWEWVSQQMEIEISSLRVPFDAYSSLATGSDQIFAEIALRCGGHLHAIVPLQGYERFFESEDKTRYFAFLSHAIVKQLDGPQENVELAFYNAGRYIVDNVDLLLAVWDGLPAAGFGGTGDIVSYAKERGLTIVHFNPISRTKAAH